MQQVDSGGRPVAGGGDGGGGGALLAELEGEACGVLKHAVLVQVLGAAERADRLGEGPVDDPHPRLLLRVGRHAVPATWRRGAARV